MNGSRPRRKGASLFEAMSKAPQGVSTGPVRAPGPKLAFWRKDRTEDVPAMMVAEPLTEEQAEAELAAERVAREEAELRVRAQLQARDAEREAKRRIAEEQKEAKVRAKAAAREAKIAARTAALQQQSVTAAAPRTEQDEVFYPFVKASRGRLIVSLNTMTGMFVAAGIAVVGMGAYTLGHRAGKSTSTDQNTLTATTPGDVNLLPEDTPSPLPSMEVAQQPEKPKKSVPVMPSGAELREIGKAARATPPHTPVVDPVAPAAKVQANAPQSLTLDTALNYLQIESFRTSGDETAEKIRNDLLDVRKFLAERGIRTIAKKRAKGYALFAAEGIPKGPEGASARAALAIKIESLGREYRRTGGRYEFKRPFWVAADEVAKGQSE